MLWRSNIHPLRISAYIELPVVGCAAAAYLRCSTAERFCCDLARYFLTGSCQLDARHCFQNDIWYLVVDVALLGGLAHRLHSPWQANIGGDLYSLVLDVLVEENHSFKKVLYALLLEACLEYCRIAFAC